jgi:hypothetical protein
MNKKEKDALRQYCIDCLAEETRLLLFGIEAGSITSKYEMFSTMQILAEYSVAQHKNTSTSGFLDELRKECGVK